MRVLEIDRVIIISEDMDETAARFEELLDVSFGEELNLSTDMDTGEQALAGKMTHEGIDVIEPRANNEIQRYLDEYGSGLYGLSVRVEDKEEARRELAEKGVEPVGHTGTGQFSEYFYSPADFGGVFVFIAEFPHAVETNFTLANK